MMVGGWRGALYTPAGTNRQHRAVQQRKTAVHRGADLDDEEAMMVRGRVCSCVCNGDNSQQASAVYMAVESSHLTVSLQRARWMKRSLAYPARPLQYRLAPRHTQSPFTIRCTSFVHGRPRQRSRTPPWHPQAPNILLHVLVRVVFFFSALLQQNSLNLQAHATKERTLPNMSSSEQTYVRLRRRRV